MNEENKIISIVLDEKLLKAIDEVIEVSPSFANRSHFVRLAVLHYLEDKFGINPFEE